MPKGMKSYRSHDVVVFTCSDCYKVFRHNNPKFVEKMLKLHNKHKHNNSKIDTVICREKETIIEGVDDNKLIKKDERTDNILKVVKINEFVA